MALTLHSPVVNVPIQGIPIAAAALDRETVIVAANHQFERLCGGLDSTSARRLSDMVAECDRSAVDEALSALTVLSDRGPQKCSIRAFRAKPPALPVTIEVVRLAAGSGVPYLACVQALPRRRRVDRLPASEPWPQQLAALSHEFRGPLTAIRGWAQIAEKGVLPPEEVARALTVIERNASRLSDMIDNLFDLSRRATGALALERDNLDLDALVLRVVESIEPAARAHHVILTAGHADGALLVNGDLPRLEQVLRNLLENAIKFTPAGGRVHVQTACAGGSFAELAVTDTGLGISADLMPVIFEPFRHDDAVLHPSERGLGLGLALVRDLVQLHGGDVRALSNGRGQGSTFIVRLPLVDSVLTVP